MSTKSPSCLTPEVLDFLKELFPGGVVFFDLETTGLSPLCDKIIEFAGIKIIDGETLEKTFLINPEVEILPENEKIHGISNEMVKTGKSQSDAAKEIESFVEGCALVAHNSLFDFGFLLTLANEKNIEFKNNPVYCTCKLSRKINKQFNSHKLSSLAESFEIRLLNHHRALDDTIACLEVFLKTIKSSTNPKTSLKDGYLFNGKDFKGGDLSDLKIPNNLKSLPELVRKKSLLLKLCILVGPRKINLERYRG